MKWDYCFISGVSATKDVNSRSHAFLKRSLFAKKLFFGKNILLSENCIAIVSLDNETVVSDIFLSHKIVQEAIL